MMTPDLRGSESRMPIFVCLYVSMHHVIGIGPIFPNFYEFQQIEMCFYAKPRFPQ